MAQNLIYIAGYGRSGTTILDIMLSCHEQIASGGEIFRAAEIFADADALCTCGAPLAECHVWGDVRHRYVAAAQDFGGLEQMQSAFMSYEGQRGRDTDGRIAPVWADLNAAAINALAAGKAGATWVIDSSKTARGAARRPGLLAQHTDTNVTLLPVQRRAGAVLNSARKGSNRAMEGGAAESDSLSRGLRAYAGWIMADAATRSAARNLTALPVLKHEALITDPDACYRQVMTGLGLTPDPNWRDRMADQDRHLIGGNRTRFETPRIRVVEGPVKDADMLTHAGQAMGRVLSRAGVF